MPGILGCWPVDPVCFRAIDGFDVRLFLAFERLFQRLVYQSDSDRPAGGQARRPRYGMYTGCWIAAQILMRSRRSVDSNPTVNVESCRYSFVSKGLGLPSARLPMVWKSVRRGPVWTGCTPNRRAARSLMSLPRARPKADATSPMTPLLVGTAGVAVRVPVFGAHDCNGPFNWSSRVGMVIRAP